MITLYNDVISRINAEYDILLEESDVDCIIRGQKTDYAENVVQTVQDMVITYVDDILGALRERGLDLKSGRVVFIGGGALLLRSYLESSDKVGKCIFIEDICANAKDMACFTSFSRKAGSSYGKKESLCHNHWVQQG